MQVPSGFPEKEELHMFQMLQNFWQSREIEHNMRTMLTSPHQLEVKGFGLALHPLNRSSIFPELVG
jgi:hypothetical protein